MLDLINGRQPLPVSQNFGVQVMTDECMELADEETKPRKAGRDEVSNGKMKSNY
ncbi:MAG: hypothetical protein Q9162_002745 [Coniocarpon cinnabarinum]